VRNTLTLSAFQPSGPRETRAETGSAPDELTLPVALQRVAADVRRRGLVLLGHPGSGKTTQLRRMALSLARGDLTDLGLDPDLVPVFIPLRKLTETDDSVKALVKRLDLLGDTTLPGLESVHPGSNRKMPAAHLARDEVSSKAIVA